MSVSELLERLAAHPAGTPLDWRKIREEIHAEHEHATTTADRVTLLAIHKAIMDNAERSIAPEYMERFKEARRQDYCLLIARETVVGENVDPHKLDEITRREVEAGRMAPDDNLREIGMIGARFLPPVPRKGGAIRKVIVCAVAIITILAVILVYIFTLVIGPAPVR
jgi:hypothetical protein